MKVVLFVSFMLTLVLVDGQNPRPCMPNRNNNAYNNFLHKHILHQRFNRGSKPDWRRYLQRNGLCNRPRQTFMEKRNRRQVRQICRGHGWRYNWFGNLCISNSPIRIYDLTVDNNCQIRSLARRRKRVVVACDAINNVCRPVHFETSTYDRPSTQYGRCR